jgi:8-oxo-dGTP pyrophosphatase MutT (NUDIX family)
MSDTVLNNVNLHKAYSGWTEPAGGSGKVSYGVVIVDDNGNVLLREPSNHYDNYVWTHAKGKQEPGYTPYETALKEAKEETGHDVEIIGLVPGAYQGGSGTTYYLLGKAKGKPGPTDTETQQIKWFNPDEAKEAIKQTTNDKGRMRDLQVLDAAMAELKKIQTGKADYSEILKAYQSQAEEIRKKLEAEAAAAAAKLAAKVIKVKPIDLTAQKKDFPTGLEKLSQGESAGGTTGAKIVTDPDTGKRYVMKRGANPGHLLSEAHADAVYQALGVKVPRMQVYNTPDGPVKLSEFVEKSTTLDKYLAQASDKEKKAVVKKLQKGFAADALLANWDVIGMDMDNILVDEKGEVWRADNGSAMQYRARGDKKGEAWSAFPTELFTMRDREREASDPRVEGAQRNSVSIYGDMSYKEVGAQCREIGNSMKEILSATPAEVRPMMQARIENMRKLGKAQEDYERGQWNEKKQERIGRQLLELGKAGVSEKLPELLKPKEEGDVKGFKIYDTAPVDEHGKKFDNLRGPNSSVIDLAKRMKDGGGDFGIIRSYLSQQSGQSWAKLPMALKYMTLQENGDPDEYYWGEAGHGQATRDANLKKAKECYDECCKHYGKAKLHKSFDIYHAYVYDLLSTTDMPNKNPDGTFEIIRTESESFIHAHHLSEGQTDCAGRRGAADSASIFSPALHEHVTITHNVPASDILAVYLHGDENGGHNNIMYGDGENEFVVRFGRKPFDYIGTRY